MRPVLAAAGILGWALAARAEPPEGIARVDVSTQEDPSDGKRTTWIRAFDPAGEELFAEPIPGIERTLVLASGDVAVVATTETEEVAETRLIVLRPDGQVGFQDQVDGTLDLAPDQVALVQESGQSVLGEDGFGEYEPWCTHDPEPRRASPPLWILESTRWDGPDEAFVYDPSSGEVALADATGRVVVMDRYRRLVRSLGVPGRIARMRFDANADLVVESSGGVVTVASAQGTVRQERDA
jgi:hypothetical protein